jgi:tRNA1Val (adenine37-N6)-methyltransferase
MKVGTDGVLLGAWADVSGAERILDIGTGTGLIALMLAQRSNAEIDAIEINKEAAFEAKQNAGNSPWQARIHIFNESFQEFVSRSDQKYDLIVCNPPYFNRSKKAPDSLRSLARHDDSLPGHELIHGAGKLLSDKGIFSVILPFTGSEKFIKLASEFQLYPAKVLKIRPVSNKEINRLIIELVKTQSQTETSEITIETDKRHRYSEEFVLLTRDFYLNF